MNKWWRVACAGMIFLPLAYLVIGLWAGTSLRLELWWVGFIGPRISFDPALPLNSLVSGSLALMGAVLLLVLPGWAAAFALRRGYELILDLFNLEDAA